MARILKADAARRVTLEDVGPVPRPVDIDEAQTGFKALKTLRIYRFSPAGTVHGHAEEDEVFIVVLAGAIELRMKSEHWSRNEESFTLSAPRGTASVTCAAYLPPHAEYALTPTTTADVAYVRALPRAGRSPAVFSTAPRHDAAGHAVLLDESTHAERLRLTLLQLDTGAHAADLLDGASLTRETLVHVRTEPWTAATAEAPGAVSTVFENGDTLAVGPSERPQIRIAPHASALGLVVSAA